MGRVLLWVGILAALFWLFLVPGEPVILDSGSGPDLPELVAPVSPEGPPGMTTAQKTALLRQIDDSDTYLSAILKSGDSMLVRWPNRVDKPLKVFIETGTVEGYDDRARRSVMDAFSRWQRVPEIPVDFVYVRRADGADVVVKWLKTFPVQRAGQADVVWRSDGLLQSGTLTLATYAFGGGRMTPDAIFTVALHEIGHLLGLGHSDNPRDVMAPTTGVHDLTARDRRTATLLYLLTPGRIGASSQGR